MTRIKRPTHIGTNSATPVVALTVALAAACNSDFGPSASDHGTIATATTGTGGASRERNEGESAWREPSGLAAHYRFNRPSSTLVEDSSIHGNHGTTKNGASWGVGANQGSLQLDGVDDHVRIGDPPTVNVTSAVSVSAWAKVLSHENKHHLIVSKEGSYEIASFPDGTIRYAINTEYPGWTWIDTGWVLPENTWTQVAIAYSSTQELTRFYVDGHIAHQESTSGAVSGGAQAAGHHELWIGARQWPEPTGSDFLHGFIDEVRIYNTAITSVDVAEIFSLGR